MARSRFFYPAKTQTTMKRLGLSERTIEDVFCHGEQIKGKNGLVKKYSGYEVGLFHALSKRTGEYAITAVWKKVRR